MELKYQQKAMDLAKLLGGEICREWQCGDGENYRLVTLSGPVLTLIFDGWRQEGRLTVWVDWPIDGNGVTHRADFEKIHLSHTRPIEKMVSDIRRRMLNTLNDGAWAACVAETKAADHRAALASAQLTLLASAIGRTAYKNNDNCVRGYGVEARYSDYSGRVELRLGNVSVDLSIQIIEMVRQSRASEQN